MILELTRQEFTSAAAAHIAEARYDWERAHIRTAVAQVKRRTVGPVVRIVAASVWDWMDDARVLGRARRIV